MSEWKQYEILHCPKCKGMLLHNPFLHEMECSDCGKYFIERIEIIETRKPILEEGLE